MPDPVRSRATALASLAEHPLDVLVVGGGATGAGVALDAATRGYRTGLVERADVASGTSSRSSKLVHGGIRYLATGDLPMVVEGVRERERLRLLAPHLVRPLGFVVPVDGPWDAAQLRVGLTVYDLLAVGRRARRHRRLDVGEVLADAPGLARGFKRGGFRFDDTQTDDARLVLAVARAARRHGATICTWTDVVALAGRRGGHHHVTVHDRLGDADLDVRARWVVHAGGVWADRLGDLGPGETGLAIQRAKGVHLVFRRDDLPVNRAVVLPSAHDRRRVFVVPWGRQVYVGTTDDLDDDGEAPVVTPDDAAYLLDAVNLATAGDLGPDDAIAAWAGWRPLVADEGATADLSRRHAVAEPRPGLVTVTGGKLTTYRRMARDVVDHLVRRDGLRIPSRTHHVDLGARGSARDGLARTARAVADAGGDPAVAGSVYHRHGDEAPTMIASCTGPDDLAPLLPDLPYLVGEVRWAVDHEWACTVDDVLSRRLRVAVRDRGAGADVAPWVAELLGDRWGWSAAERERQVAAYLDGVGRERGPVAPPPRSDREPEDTG